MKTRLKIATVVFAVVIGLSGGINTSTNIVQAATSTDSEIKINGTLFKAGTTTEVRIKTISDFRALKGKTLRLVVDSKPVEFGVKNVTRAQYKGPSNSKIFDALMEVLAQNPDSDENVYEMIVDLNSVDKSYEALKKSLNEGILNNTVELLEVSVYDESYKAKSSSKKTLRFLVGGGEYTNENLAAEDDEGDSKSDATELTPLQKKTKAAVKLISKDKTQAKKTNISLNKMGNIISEDVISAISQINSNSVISFRFRNEKTKMLKYEWQIMPDAISAPKRVNMELSFASSRLGEFVEAKGVSEYTPIVMQQMGDLGGRYTLGVKISLVGAKLEDLKLYTVDMQSGKIEKKNQKLTYNKTTGLVYFSVAYGENYVITSEQI